MCCDLWPQFGNLVGGGGGGAGAFLSGSNRTVKVNAIPGSRRFFFSGGEAGALISEFYGAHKLVTEMEVLLHAI